uniref:AlNc14C81G5301 protein n=1 Tax=Albugo laibachii Nc14 TaxID=890382 RepID=F0WFB1_9STRA|nr:AlNc14C81G5301 [Albugo laibachii Nc14]|eukprot:CCA19893.1 AlNc14C81G5301 [Albugo laibachii Nc14]
MKSEKRVEWKEAANTELAFLEANNTWTIAPRTDGIKALHNKWGFIRKTDADGSLERFKTRMIACGNDKVDSKIHCGSIEDMEHATKAWRRTKCVHQSANLKKFGCFFTGSCGDVYISGKLRQLGVSSRAEVVLLASAENPKSNRSWIQTKPPKFVFLLRSRIRWSQVLGVLYRRYSGKATSDAIIESAFQKLSSLSIKTLGQVSKCLGMRFSYSEREGYSLHQESSVKTKSLVVCAAHTSRHQFYSTKVDETDSCANDKRLSVDYGTDDVT